MSTFPSLADALKGHREDYDSVFPSCECGWEQGDDSGVGPFWRDHADALWREACTIRTVEQLDVLPSSSIILAFGHGAVQKIFGLWYPVGGTGEVRELYRLVLSDALLVWHPDWKRA